MSMTKGVVITGTDGQVWVSGSRGKPPAWVSNHPDYIKLKSEMPQDTVKKEVKSDEGLKFWKWSGSSTKDRCVVAAFDPINAVKLLARRFKMFPVTASEFSTLWKSTPALEDVKVPGVYELKDSTWVCTIAA